MSTELKKMVFYIPEDIKNDLKVIADSDGRKMANWVSHLVKTTVEARTGGSGISRPTNQNNATSQEKTNIASQEKTKVESSENTVTSKKVSDKVLNGAGGWI